MFPTVIVRMARTTQIGCQLSATGSKAVMKTLSSAANAPAFGTTVMSAVMTVGAPS